MEAAGPHGTPRRPHVNMLRLKSREDLAVFGEDDRNLLLARLTLLKGYKLHAGNADECIATSLKPPTEQVPQRCSTYRSVYISFYLSVYSVFPIYISIHLSSNLAVIPSISRSIYRSTVSLHNTYLLKEARLPGNPFCLSVYRSIHLLDCLYVYNLSDYQSTHQPVYLFIYLSLYQSFSSNFCYLCTSLPNLAESNLFSSIHRLFLLFIF